MQCGFHDLSQSYFHGKRSNMKLIVGAATLLLLYSSYGED